MQTPFKSFNLCKIKKDREHLICQISLASPIIFVHAFSHLCRLDNPGKFLSVSLSFLFTFKVKTEEEYYLLLRIYVIMT